MYCTAHRFCHQHQCEDFLSLKAIPFQLSSRNIFYFKVNLNILLWYNQAVYIVFMLAFKNALRHIQLHTLWERDVQ